MKIREKIRALVWRRLEIMGPAREAVRRALAILAMPQNVPLGAAHRLAHAPTVMWRIAGDTSTDFNHYTKRMTLGAVYGATLLVWLDDESEGWTRHRRLPRPADRRRDAVREAQGGLARLVRAPQPVALPRPAALPAAVSAGADQPCILAVQLAAR